MRARDIELKFRERNWLIGLRLLEYLLGFDEQNFIKLFISIRDAYRYVLSIALKISIEGLVGALTTVHIFNTMFSSSKNKVIDAGT